MDDVKLLRLSEVLKIIPISKSGWWKGVAEGRFPRGYKLGPRTTVWFQNDILALLERIKDGSILLELDPITL